uniref:Uncharacterized protein n=1 Tax=Myotis myotis TaxID=51298 RepID=A0A7J7RRV0_MYOMY|nr:hypothetical protein mMyoMyo1_010212 [Myotis myotis]
MYLFSYLQSETRTEKERLLAVLSAQGPSCTRGSPSACGLEWSPSCPAPRIPASEVLGGHAAAPNTGPELHGFLFPSGPRKPWSRARRAALWPAACRTPALPPAGRGPPGSPASHRRGLRSDRPLSGRRWGRPASGAPGPARGGADLSRTLRGSEAAPSPRAQGPRLPPRFLRVLPPPPFPPISPGSRDRDAQNAACEAQWGARSWEGDGGGARLREARGRPLRLRLCSSLTKFILKACSLFLGCGPEITYKHIRRIDLRAGAACRPPSPEPGADTIWGRGGRRALPPSQPRWRRSRTPPCVSGK